jgi:hypothetical protein
MENQYLYTGEEDRLFFENLTHLQHEHQQYFEELGDIFGYFFFLSSDGKTYLKIDKRLPNTIQNKILTIFKKSY